uniref:Uncharacterized protein n=1 Tax=Romanomermis culicivorax TaxID=13658 RepID=A0A915IG65_ROMCU
MRSGCVLDATGMDAAMLDSISATSSAVHIMYSSFLVSTLMGMTAKSYIIVTTTTPKLTPSITTNKSNILKDIKYQLGDDNITVQLNKHAITFTKGTNYSSGISTIINQF